MASEVVKEVLLEKVALQLQSERLKKAFLSKVGGVLSRGHETLDRE